MATLAELWDSEPTAKPDLKLVPAKPVSGGATLPSGLDRKREEDRLRILEEEFAIKPDPDLQTELTAQRKRLNIAPTSQQPVGTLADLWESTPATAAPAEPVKPAPFIAQSETSGVSANPMIMRQGQKIRDQNAYLTEVPQSSVRELAKKLGISTAAALDTLAQGITAPAQAITYATVRPFVSAERAQQISTLPESVQKPVGTLFGVTESPSYKGELSQSTMKFIGENVGKGAEWISKQTGLPVSDVENMVNTLTVAVPGAVKPVAGALKTAGQVVGEMGAVKRQIDQQFAARQAVNPTAPAEVAPGRASVGAAAASNASIIEGAIAASSPELQQVVSAIPVNKVNIPTLMRHVEADSLDVPVRLTEGQATGDIVKLSQEQNRRGKDPELAQRFNEQNNQLVENLGRIRETAAPDVYGTKTIENSEGIINAYKTLDDARNTDIRAAYKNLEDANGGQFPVDGKTLATNAEAMLSKKLKSEFLPSSIKTQLDRFKAGEPMTFEQFEAMRTNLAAEIRKAERSGDGNAAMASGIVRQALEDLPMPEGVGSNLKAIADNARTLAKQRFDMLKKDPAYKAAVNDTVPADKYFDKFVINGVNKNINTMVEHLGKDSEAHQHMAAGTVNWLKNKAGIVDETGNFSQAGYNQALKKLDDVRNLHAIFTPEAQTKLKTLGNVARYTQAQPRGSFVNNSNTLVGALYEKGKNLVGKAVEVGINTAIPYAQIGTSLVEMKARRAAAKETARALESGAGIKSTPINKMLP